MRGARKTPGAADYEHMADDYAANPVRATEVVGPVEIGMTALRKGRPRRNAQGQDAWTIGAGSLKLCGPTGLRLRVRAIGALEIGLRPVAHVRVYAAQC